MNHIIRTIEIIDAGFEIVEVVEGGLFNLVAGLLLLILVEAVMGFSVLVVTIAISANMGFSVLFVIIVVSAIGFLVLVVVVIIAVALVVDDADGFPFCLHFSSASISEAMSKLHNSL